MGDDKMKLVVGLGNPGKEYEKTRHNIGYMFLDFITNNASFSLNKKFNAMEYEMIIGNEQIIFIKPLTFMNLSGEAVIKYANFYKINPADILVIQDDLDMDLGKYKLLFNRGDGGHNGIKNIILNLGTKAFLRLKIGISKASINTKDYVLGKLNKNEYDTLIMIFEKLKDFIYDYVTINHELLMGKYNVREKEENK